MIIQKKIKHNSYKLIASHIDYEFRVFFDAIFCICNRICSC